MKMQLLKTRTLPFIVGALLLALVTGCGQKNDASGGSEVAKIPEAPAEAMQHIARELATGDGAVLWQAMPASYQSDVNSIAQLAGTKIDAEIYDQVFATLNRLATVMDQQKEFVFNTSLGGDEKDQEAVAQMRAAWPSVMEIVGAITSSPLSSAQGLQSFEGQAFFQNTVSTVLANMDALAQLQPESDQPKLSDFGEIEVNYIEGTENEATLEMAIPNQEVETKTFVKVEDRWVPQDMAEGWTTQMAETRSKLEAIDPAKLEQQKPQIMGVFTMLDGVLTQIEAAESQEQFDQALKGAMMPLMGVMMMGQGMGGSGGAAPAMPEMQPAQK